MKRFWEEKTLFEMTPAEWESVCDGCAKCCLIQLQDTDSKQVVLTDVACKLLDHKTCRCTDYAQRSVRVPNCMSMHKANVVDCIKLAPASCSYRLLLEQKPLPNWHHLISQDRQLVHKQGHSVQNRVRSERDIDAQKLEDYVVEWQ